MDNSDITLKRNSVSPVIPVFLNTEGGEGDFQRMFNRLKWNSPDVYFLKMAALWKRALSSGERRKRLRLGEYSFSLINGKLHGVVLTICYSSKGISLSMIVQPYKEYHCILYKRKEYISKKLQQLFPDEIIEFFIHYETK